MQNPNIIRLMESLKSTGLYAQAACKWTQTQCREAPLSRIWAVCGGITLLCLALIFFNTHDDANIHTLLDARDHAVSERNISAYARLISDDYLDRGRSKHDVVALVEDMFHVFSELNMRSFDRKIRLIDAGRAECKQSYKLKVQTGADWRQMIQQEQLRLRHTDDGWKIIGGL